MDNGHNTYNDTNDNGNAILLWNSNHNKLVHKFHGNNMATISYKKKQINTLIR